MRIFDISWIAMFKIMGAGAFTFVVLPLFLVLRDMLLHKVIGKWILTDKLNSLIGICENKRWFLNNKYNKSNGVSYGSDATTYNIDDKSVTIEEFDVYEKSRSVHSKRFRYADSKIAIKYNLITWLTRHYRQADGGNPIPSLRASYMLRAAYPNPVGLNKTMVITL